MVLIGWALIEVQGDDLLLSVLVVGVVLQEGAGGINLAHEDGGVGVEAIFHGSKSIAFVLHHFFRLVVPRGLVVHLTQHRPDLGDGRGIVVETAVGTDVVEETRAMGRGEALRVQAVDGIEHGRDGDDGGFVVDEKVIADGELREEARHFHNVVPGAVQDRIGWQ